MTLPRISCAPGRSLRTSFADIHKVTDRERAALLVRIQDTLDRGESSLWAHALGRQDDWVLCGPDRASLLCGIRLGFRERLVAPESLLETVGFRPRTKLKPHHKKKWHNKTLNDLVVEEQQKNK